MKEVNRPLDSSFTSSLPLTTRILNLKSVQSKRAKLSILVRLATHTGP